MKAVVLCAGKGTRIREITKNEKPKPMVEVEDKPILEHTLQWLSDHGVTEVMINLHHKGDKIREYFGRSYNSIEISYFNEDELLGTAGALNQMRSDLEDNFFVVYGDIVSNIDLSNLMRTHKSNNSIGTLVIYSGEKNLTESSIITLNDNKEINEFIEKPDIQTISDFEAKIWTNAGIYCLDPAILDFIDEKIQDFSHDIFPKVLSSSDSLEGFDIGDSYWKEIGNPESYMEFKENISKLELDW